jgi:hypothetical protein
MRGGVRCRACGTVCDRSAERVTHSANGTAAVRAYPRGHAVSAYPRATQYAHAHGATQYAPAHGATRACMQDEEDVLKSGNDFYTEAEVLEVRSSGYLFRDSGCLISEYNVCNFGRRTVNSEARSFTEAEVLVQREAYAHRRL